MKVIFLSLIFIGSGFLWATPEDQFKKDFLVYVKFLQDLPAEELFNPLVVEDVTRLYKDGRFRHDAEMQQSVTQLVKSVASKASRPGISYYGRQFAAELAADHVSQGADVHDHIKIQQLVNKISSTHEREEVARITKEQQEADKARAMRNAIKSSLPQSLVAPQNSLQVPEVFIPLTNVRQVRTKKSSAASTKKKVSATKSEQAVKSSQLQSDVAAVPVVRAKRVRAKKESSIAPSSEAIEPKKRRAKLSAITPVPKRVRKKSS